MKTTVEIRLGEKADYYSLKLFDSACWPNLRPYNTIKLAFRSTQCVFIGYNHVHICYKCLDPKTRRAYISRGVVFVERFFF